MNKSKLLLVVALLLIIFSVLFFTGYLPKFELVGPVTWYFRNDLTLSTSSTSSETYTSAVAPSSPIYFGIEFLADSRTLTSFDIKELSSYISASVYTYSIKFNAIINLNEDVKMKLYFRTASSRFLEVAFSSGVLKAGSFSVDGTLQYKIQFVYLGTNVGTAFIYYGGTDEFISGVSYFIPPPPTADFSYNPNNPSIADNIVFNASLSTGVNLTTYKWDFYYPNNTLYNTVIESDPITTMTLPVVGNWTVKLTVTDAYNQQGSTSKIISVSEYPLSVDFSWNPDNQVEGSAISFTATYYSKYGVKSFSWNFGDYSTDYGQNVSHTYLNGGTYQVTVTVTDNNDKQASSTKQVNVLYIVKFTESGLPSGTSWKVIFNNIENTATGDYIVYNINGGTFTFTVESLDVRYVPKPNSGTITVPDIKTLTITFTRQPLTDIEITGPSSLPENTIGNYTLKPKIQNVMQPNYPVRINILKDGVQVDTKEVYSDESGIAVFTYGFTTGGTYSLDFYDADLNVFVKSFTLTVKASLSVISETQLIQTYDLSGDVDFNAIFRIKAENNYTSDFNIVNLTLIDEKTGISIPYESYKEDYSVYVKAYLFKYYGTADDRDIRLSLELSSNTYLGISYSLIVKMTKPTIVVYMTDSSGQLIKSFVTGTNTFYLKFEAKGLNVNPSDVNITVINPEGVKSSVSPYDIVPAGTNIVKVTYTFEKAGTYVFVIELHGVVEMPPKTFTYSINEPYNFFRYDNPFFVMVVIIAILVAYSLVKRKRNV